jgi:hypothetical protein
MRRKPIPIGIGHHARRLGLGYQSSYHSAMRCNDDLLALLGAGDQFGELVFGFDDAVFSPTENIAIAWL